MLKKREKKERKEKERKEKKTGKRFKKRYLLIGALVVALVSGIVYSRAASGPVVVPVECIRARTGDLDETVSVSGKVVSDKSETCFAPVGAKVSQVLVAEGDEVQAGQKLIVFDTAELEENSKKADLEVSSASSNYQSALQDSNKNQSKYADATIGLEELKTMEENQRQYVQGLTYQLEDNVTARRKDLLDWDKKLQEELNYQNRRLAQAAPGSSEEESIYEIIDNVTAQRTDVQNDLNMIDQEENIKQQQRLIDFEQQKLSDMQEEIQRRESRQSSSESGILNGYAQKERQIAVESAKLGQQEAKQKLDLAAAGVSAGISGIVTQVQVVEGATAAEGAALVTIESDREVKVTVELNRYELEKVKEGQQAEVTIAGNVYQGVVEKINRMAQNNQQNTLVVYADISLKDPDENLYLGVDGKAQILTAQAQGAVLAPYEAINTDTEGDFCYVVKEGVIAKERIVTGISDDTDVEILEGIADGDTIVISAGQDLEEGMQVMPVMRE